MKTVPKRAKLMQKLKVARLAQRLRQIAQGIDGTGTEEALLEVIKELETTVGGAQEYAFVANRIAVCSFSTVAKNYDEAREKAEIFFNAQADKEWDLDNEIEIQDAAPERTEP